MWRFMFIITFPIVATIIWNVLDANPTLWLYDFATSGNFRDKSHDFENQTIWVTGASSGIGAALVCQLAQQGAQHVILSARRTQHMERVVEACRRQIETGSTIPATTFSIIPYDALLVNDTVSTVQNAIQSTPHHSIDVLIMNSGIYQAQLALDTTPEYRRKLLRVNLEAPIDLSQALIQQDHWKEREQGGHLVVISSLTAKGPQSLSSTYAATKAGLRSYFQTLSTEEFHWLKVQMILPGATASDMWKNSLNNQVQPDTGTLMTTDRVASLICTAIHGPYVMLLLFYEVWIAKSIGLTYAWMSHYTPTLFYFANHLVGLARVTGLTKYQMDMLEVPALLQTAWEGFWEKVAK